jgi:hypothetical protein
VDPVEDVEVAWAALAEGVVLCRAGDCQAILRGARCEGGDTAEDYDRGEIIRIDGSGAEVKWDSQQTTRQALSVLRAESKHAFAEKITIDPSDPFAGLVTPEDQGEVLAGWIREKGAERLAVELLSEASGAGCGTWSDETRLALVSALEKHAEADYAARARMAEGI